MDHGLPAPWRAFAQDARQGGGWGNFADTPITPNLLVIEAAMSIMVMVLLVIMVVVVFFMVIMAVVVFLVDIMVMVMVVVVLVMFLLVGGLLSLFIPHLA